MKYIILVGDGMGDLPLSELGARTPLEAADTPTMDSLCRNGELFRLQTIPDGMPPGSDIANLSLLGYEPQDFYTGRAPLEAASMGVELTEGETAYRCNLVNLEKKDSDSLIMVDFSAGHIPTTESSILVNDLQEKLGSDLFHFYPGISYRHLMTAKNSLAGLATVPPHDYIGKNVARYWKHYLQYPELQRMLEAAGLLLENHPVNKQRLRKGELPANCIWLWGEGKAPDMPTLEAQYGLSGSLISAVDLLKGIGIYGGLNIINVAGATGYLDTNYAGKAAAALETLDRQDFVFVHVEAPDEAGHQGSIPDKIRAIEDFDAKIVKPILEGLQAAQDRHDFRLVVCMDHLTPISIRTHTDQPVPVLLFDSRQDGAKSGLAYTEKNGETTGVLLTSGREFFHKLLQKDRVKP
ncbi:MAG: cofactor-independent phosphoglycerate mutase [Desulfobulbales bacterium]|nr:cofactor-independent phosphoglycerate mutase [Desulfobulbales bacterium]